MSNHFINSLIDELKNVPENEQRTITVPIPAYNFWIKHFRSILANNFKTKKFKWSVKQNPDRTTAVIVKLGMRFQPSRFLHPDANYFYAPCSFCLQKIRIGELPKHGSGVCAILCEECGKHPGVIKSHVGQDEIMICGLCNLQFNQKHKKKTFMPSFQMTQKVNALLMFNDIPTPRRHRITYEEAYSRNSQFSNENRYSEI